MRDSSVPTEVKDPVAEARRYVQNAKDVLQKADLNTETQLYRDPKYVRMAGNTLWNGVLVILEAVFQVTDNNKTRPHFSDYQRAIAQRDYKLLDFVTTGYNVMHLSMGYDGNRAKSTCQDGFRLANEIIDRCAAMLNKSKIVFNEKGFN